MYCTVRLLRKVFNLFFVFLMRQSPHFVNYIRFDLNLYNRNIQCLSTSYPSRVWLVTFCFFSVHSAWTTCTVKTCAKAQNPQPPALFPVLLLLLQEWTETWVKTFITNRAVSGAKSELQLQESSIAFCAKSNVKWSCSSSDLSTQYLPEETWSAPSIPLTNEFRYNTTEALPYIPQPPPTRPYNG